MQQHLDITTHAATPHAARPSLSPQALELTAATASQRSGGADSSADAISPEAFGVLCDRYGIVPFRRAAGDAAGGGGEARPSTVEAGGSAAGAGAAASSSGSLSGGVVQLVDGRAEGTATADEVVRPMSAEIDFDFAPLKRARGAGDGGGDGGGSRPPADGGAGGAAGDAPARSMPAGLGRRRSSISNLQALVGGGGL